MKNNKQEVETENNYDNVSEKFKSAICEIETTIKFLQLVRDSLLILDKNLPVVDAAALNAAVDLAARLTAKLNPNQN